MMKKIVTIVGARPQFVKVAPVSNILRKRFSEYLIHTGQHYDQLMSDVFFSQLNIPKPDLNLNIGSGSHAVQTGAMLVGIEKVLQSIKPDLVLLYGDTNSTLAAALVAVKIHIPIAHVEAGLRDIDLMQPEEVNRRMTDLVSSFLFTPSQTASENLRKENLTVGIHFVGDVMFDVMQQFEYISEAQSSILDDWGLSNDNYYLVTIHRPHNTDDEKVLEEILEVLSSLEKPVLFPVHPRTLKVIKEYQLNTKNIRLCSPLSYLDFQKAARHSYKIVTDSGGVQKEAYLLKKPCVTIDYTSPWIETVAQGWNILSSHHHDELKENISRSNGGSSYSFCYGHGNAAEKIVDFLSQNL